MLVGVDADLVLRCGRCARCCTLHVGVWWCRCARRKGMEEEKDAVRKGEMYPDLSASPKLKLDLKLKNRVRASVICQKQKNKAMFAIDTYVSIRMSVFYNMADLIIQNRHTSAVYEDYTRAYSP